jgi:hypothetical protein
VRLLQTGQIPYFQQLAQLVVAGVVFLIHRPDKMAALVEVARLAAA